MNNLEYDVSGDSKRFPRNPRQLRYDINPWEDLSPKEMVIDAGNFMMDYIQSEKYRELLINEIKINNHINLDDWNSIRHLRDELPFPWTPEEIADQIIQQRATSINASRIGWVDHIWSDRTYIWQTEYDYNRDQDSWEAWNTNVTFEKSLFKNNRNQDMAVHEFTHASTGWNYHIIPFTFVKLEESAGTNDPYYGKPTEIHARITAVKYMLRKTWICNPLIDDVKERDIDELLKYKFMEPLIDWDIYNALLDLLNYSKITKQRLVELMNEIAENQPNWIENKDIKHVA